MVKGISRQVIVVNAPEPKLFEQAIFILKEDALSCDGVTDEALLREARRLLHTAGANKKLPYYYSGPMWACGGALLTGFVWLMTALM